MSYSRGDLVIVPFPFVLESGRQEQKARPALVVSDETVDRRYADLILAAITSRAPRELKVTELLLKSNKRTGLKKESVLRTEFLMTLPPQLVARKIGRLSDNEMKKVDEKLALSLGILRKPRRSRRA
jgi:mRNA interferase MazF